jgi:hypothetical protein
MSIIEPVKHLAFVAAMFTSLTSGVALAGTLSSSQLMQYCALGNMANKEGISARYMFEQTLAKKGQPKYLANVIMNEIKPVCPKVY